MRHKERMKISEEYNIAVIITNQVMSDPSGGMTFVQDPKKPIGGHVLAHASTVRLSLRKGKGEQRYVKVIDHPCMRAFPSCDGHTAYCTFCLATGFVSISTMEEPSRSNPRLRTTAARRGEGEKGGKR